MTVGSALSVVDGKGGWHAAELISIGRDKASARILETRTGVGEPTYELVVAIGMLKSRSRFEVFIEKAVELGVSKIVPMVSERSEESSVNERRCRAICLAAMKQSGRSVLPEVTSLSTFRDALSISGDLLLCHEAARHGSTIARSIVERRTAPTVVLIGPEGGFSDEEVAQAEAKGATIVTLGSRRLRAETAGIVAASQIAARFDELAI